MKDEPVGLGVGTPYISIRNGKKFYLAGTEHEQLEPEDIAFSLSKICRFGGSCRVFYSVAEHSAVVAQILGSQGHGPALQLAGLMHDAHEMITSDIPRPIKQIMPLHIRAYIQTLQDRIDYRIWRGLGLCNSPAFTALRKHKASIKQADNIALSAEASDLMVGSREWSNMPTVDQDIVIQNLNPERAFSLWMSEWERLTEEVEKISSWAGAVRL